MLVVAKSTDRDYGSKSAESKDGGCRLKVIWQDPAGYNNTDMKDVKNGAALKWLIGRRREKM